MYYICCSELFSFFLCSPDSSNTHRDPPTSAFIQCILMQKNYESIRRLEIMINNVNELIMN